MLCTPKNIAQHTEYKCKRKLLDHWFTVNIERDLYPTVGIYSGVGIHEPGKK